MAEQENPMVPASGFAWDEEATRDLISAKEGHIRDTTIYITAALWAWMCQIWGVVTFVKTATDLKSGEVTVAEAREGEKGAIKVRYVGALNSVEFSFLRPLHKLGLKVPPARQFNVVPVSRELPGVGTVFVFPMAQRKSVPRNLKEEAVAKSGQEAAPTAQGDGHAGPGSNTEK